ncbi:MAG: type II toxin-antitoxin system VapC family toxin [Caulobacteraceae bacterium]
MTAFVDASALISMIAGEADALELAERLEAESVRLCSALSAWETLAGLRRTHDMPLESARGRIRAFREAFGIGFVAIGEPEFEIAADAYEQFGKGRHPAALNFGDCLAYACAKANGASLLFKGEDFVRTDIVAC